jgi:hypothetical protein
VKRLWRGSQEEVHVFVCHPPIDFAPSSLSIGTPEPSGIDWYMLNEMIQLNTG